MFAARRLALLSLAAALHTTVLVPAAALADVPKPSGVARPAQDLTARGQALFDDQQYEESIQTLSGALVRPNNTTQQKIEIYRLLALNYITLQRKDEAEAAVRGLLALEPTYELPPRESPRFRDYFAAVKLRWEAEGRPGLVKETEALPAAVTMRHASPPSAEARKQIDLTASLEDPQSRVAEVKLYYRTGSKGKFEEASAALVGGHVTASIPPPAVMAPLVEYYLQGLDKAGLPLVSRGDAAAPLRIPVPEGGGGWVVPVAIGGGLAVAGAIVAGLAAGGAFKGSAPGSTSHPPPGPGQGTVTVTVGSAGFGGHW